MSYGNAFKPFHGTYIAVSVWVSVSVAVCLGVWFVARKLSDILSSYSSQSALGKLTMLNDIRAYIRVHSYASVVDEINAVTSAKDINVLIGAGMRGPLYLALLKRKAEIEGI